MKKQAGANFDSIAKPYRWLEFLTFGPMLMRCRLEHLPQLHDRRNALVLGDGDGRFLAKLLSAVPELHAVVVDSSEAMLRLLSQRVAAVNASDRVLLCHTDALAFRPQPEGPLTGNYDLVVSHFFLDCFDDYELDELLKRICPVLSPGSMWVLSDFNVPIFSDWRQIFTMAALAVVQALYLAFRLATGLRVRSLPDYVLAMRNRGLCMKARRTWLGGWLISELWIKPLGGDEPNPRINN